MSKLIKKLSAFSKNKVFWIILITALTIPTFSVLLKPGFFAMQDDLQAFRVYEMDKCYTDLQIPCRWVPDAGYKYGYPQFNYYPPLPYYIGAAMHRVGIQYIDTIKILFILGYVLSAITMFLLVSGLTGSYWPSFIASLAYTYIPYKAVEVYVRGALSEFWAQIFFPLIFWAIYKLIKSGKTKYLIWTGLSIFLIMTTHTLMTMIFAPVAIIWAAYWLFKTRWKNMGKVVAGGILGFCLSAFFILPVIFEKQFAHTESMLSGYFDYRQHFVSLYKLFVSREWGYGSSGFPNEKLNLSLGIVQWIVGLVIAPVVALINFKKPKRFSIPILGLTSLALFSIFMIHMKSSFIWAHLPFLWYMQFPWRFLAVSIFLLCLLVGLTVHMFGKYKYIFGILLVAISFILTISFYVPKTWFNSKDTDKFSGVSWQKQMTISIFDYLPIYAKLPPITQAPDFPEIMDGKADFSDYKKGSDFQIGDLEVTEDATLRLPLFDFPGMQVKVDGKVVKHGHDDCRNEEFCLGLINFKLPKGEHHIETRLTDTPIRRAGNYLSIVGVAAVIWLLIKKNEKHNN